MPTFQLKKEFSGYFINPLRMFRGWGDKAALVEKSVVRPTYSYLGDFSISDRVIVDLALYIMRKAEEVAEIVKTAVESSAGGIKINIAAVMIHKPSVISAAARLQAEISAKVEAMTAFNVEAVNIEIRGLKEASWKHEGESIRKGL